MAGAIVRFGSAITKFSEPLRGNGTAGSDIVLVKDQAARDENGLYWANTGGVMVRAFETWFRPTPPCAA